MTAWYTCRSIRNYHFSFPRFVFWLIGWLGEWGPENTIFIYHLPWKVIKWGSVLVVLFWLKYLNRRMALSHNSLNSILTISLWVTRTCWVSEMSQNDEIWTSINIFDNIHYTYYLFSVIHRLVICFSICSSFKTT